MSSKPTVIKYKVDKLLQKVSIKYPLLNIEFNNGEVEYKETGKEKEEIIPPYIPREDLKTAIELAQILQRPLLIRGEPGSGKTRLAKAFAYEKYGLEYKKHYFEWHIKSTSKALDGLYNFDHLSRLRDVQNPNSEEETQEKLEKYRKLGPLGKAFAVSTKDKPSILLIDEIDKADLDFPNDLLLELDEKRFQIPETGEEVAAKYPPIIIITSNQEKELPPAFLRRCVYHYIKFPTANELRKIIEGNFPRLMNEENNVVNNFISKFDTLRKKIKNDPSVSKQLSTSELIDWLKIINYHFENGIDINKIDVKTTLPFHQAILKSYNDLIREGIITNE